MKEFMKEIPRVDELNPKKDEVENDRKTAAAEPDVIDQKLSDDDFVNYIRKLDIILLFETWANDSSCYDIVGYKLHLVLAELQCCAATHRCKNRTH